MGIDNMVYGHAKAKRVLEVMIKRSQERYYKKIVKGESDYPESLRCLLIGESGTGKTHLINSLKKIYNFPLLTLDATHLMPTGNSDGMNQKQLVNKIKQQAVDAVTKGEFLSVDGYYNQLVIFVDEFDKLGTSFDSSGNWNKHVQSNFLTLIDNKEEFSGISWIFAGAFSTLYERKPSSIGFFSVPTEAEEAEITDRDIIRSGLIPEIVGRISAIVQLDQFTFEDYKQILINHLLPKYPHLSGLPDVDSIVRKAVVSGQGIRSLKRQLEMLSIELEYEPNCGNYIKRFLP